MSAGWTAAGVRGRGLLTRRFGADQARRLAELPTLDAALSDLAATPYRRELRPGMGLAEAQRGTSAVVLWHLRVLAGWSPPLGAAPLRIVAGGFELANITGQMVRLRGGRAPDPYNLGSMGSAWPAVGAAGTPLEVRTALAASAWGDPGTDDLPAMQLALQVSWARRCFDDVPGAGTWAAAAAAVVVARILTSGARGSLGSRAERDLTHILGPGWQQARSLAELLDRLPDPAAGPLAQVRQGEELWRSESRWWNNVETAATKLATEPRPGASAGVGIIALLAADARHVRAALALASAGGGSLDEVCGDVA